MVTHYKCPNCGADMAFDTGSGTLKCGSCGREDTIEKMAGQPDPPGNAQVSYDLNEEDKRALENSYDNDYEDSSAEDDPTHHHAFREGEASEYN